MSSTLFRPKIPNPADETKLIDGLAQLDWSAPASARLTTCALFRCPPVIASKPGQEGRLEIINYDRCVIASSQSTQPDGSFDWRDPDLQYIPTDGSNLTVGVACTDSANPDPILIGEFLVGCWAYDDWELIAATKVYSLPFSDAVGVPGIVDECGEGGEGIDGKTCQLDLDYPGSNVFGTCVGTAVAASSPGTDPRCVPRCIRMEDCEGFCPDSRPACERAEGEKLGICRCKPPETP